MTLDLSHNGRETGVQTFRNVGAKQTRLLNGKSKSNETIQQRIFKN